MPATAEVRRSSISTTGYLDGLGRRSIRFDREFGATLECLHVRPELRAYEDALLAQACALSELGESNAVRIRSLEREHGRLVVISELPRGARLSDVFDTRPAGATSSIDATFGFLLQILPTLANLHRASIVHGAIAPGRVMVEANGRVVLADAVFGTALPRLNLSPSRLWHELEIAFAPGRGTAGCAADVAQAALCSIAVALGRQLDTEDPRQAVPSMIEHLAELAYARGGDRLSKDVRTLFHSLLPLEGSAADATAAQVADRIREIAARDLGEEACTKAFVAFVRDEKPATVIASFEETTEAPAERIAQQAASEVQSNESFIEDAPILQPEVPVPAHTVVAHTVSNETDAVTEPTPVRVILGVGAEPESEPGGVLRFAARIRAIVTSAPVPWKVAGAAAALAIAIFTGVSFMQADSGPATTASSSSEPAATTATKPPAAAPNPNVGLLTVTSQPAGAKVLLDGVDAGQTPLRLDAVTPGRHTVTTIVDNVATKRTVRIEAGKTVTIYAGSATAQIGWMTIQAPLRLEVSDGSRKLGTSDQRRIDLAPGRHVITLSNRSVGYSSVHTVEVTAGREAVVKVSPTGRVNLNAQPWAEVWIDGTRAGETPLANIQVPLGARQFVFKHPQYGERKMTATVSTSPTALSVDFTKPSQ